MSRSWAAVHPERAWRGLATPEGFVRGRFSAMGTWVDVLLPSEHGRLVGEVETLFATWEAVLSRFRPQSDLSRLNAGAGRVVPVGELLFTVVAAALRGAAASDGLFDPTLLRRLEALGYDRTFSEVLARDRNSAHPAAGWDPQPYRAGAWRSIELDAERRTIRLPAEARLDLGGIAKGMAVDAAIDVLEQAGCRLGGVDAGGDLAVIGLPSAPPGWPIRIELPQGDRTVCLTGGALATSGISRRRWRWAGREVHHIIDPRTGISADSGLWSATAVAGSCEVAEVAATAAFLLGPTDGAAWLTARELDGLLVAADGHQLAVGAWALPAGSLA